MILPIWREKIQYIRVHAFRPCGSHTLRCKCPGAAAHSLLSLGSLGTGFAKSWKDISSVRPKSILQVAMRQLTLGRLLAYRTCLAAVTAGLYTGFSVSNLKIGYLTGVPRQLKTWTIKAVCQ